MFSDDFFKKAEFRIVNVDDIVEYPTELGNRCLLLRQLDLNPYFNTEEEIMDALTESTEHPEHLEICLKYSRCQAFWDSFKERKTPFTDRDPIQLYEYGGRYWVVEGKHRVCLAKRAGIEKLQAYVWHLPEDSESLFPNKGKPGQYRFRYDYPLDRTVEAQGDAAILWVKNLTGAIMPRWLSHYPVLLGMQQDTKGEYVSLFPGFLYCINAKRAARKTGIFRRQEFLSVETEIRIEEGHKKTKIWLITIPACKVFSLRPAGLLPLKTVYRYGNWRKHHAKLLQSMCFGLYNFPA